MDALTDDLNEKIKASAATRENNLVKVLIIYWQDGDIGFRDEGQDLGRMFQQLFNYPVEEFAIPSAQSYLELQKCLNGAVLSLLQQSGNNHGAPLLIVHYGGHGDANDDRRLGEEKEISMGRVCLFAKVASYLSDGYHSQGHGGPTLEWFRIQDDLKSADLDILLLLDCCFAAQAGRGRRSDQGRLEILAAAAMGSFTPMPGDRSFTRALIKACSYLVNHETAVVTTRLHQRLIARDANLVATPIYITLKNTDRRISLVPLATTATRRADEDFTGTYFQILFRTPQLPNTSELEDIAVWLGEDKPRMVTALGVQRILQTTNQLREFAEGMRQHDRRLWSALKPLEFNDILKAWDSLKTAIEHAKVAARGTNSMEGEFHAKERMQNFLKQLDAKNAEFADTVGRTILNSSLSENPATLKDFVEDSVSQLPGIAEQLHLRQIVCSTTEQGLSQSEVNDDGRRQPAVLQEYKRYGRYVDPAEMADLTARVSRLAELLHAPKDCSFQTLHCRNWFQESLEDRFVLEFKIPTQYDSAPGSYWSLQDVISKTRGTERPSLEFRLKAGLLLAKAVQKWHSVGWVHQGISSPNVLFLRLLEGGRLDYSNPFLQGFEFARPKSDPSMGRPQNDLAFNVYRHPERQGVTRKGHTKIHDIYSLGVVLLEIGLWQAALDIVKPRKKDDMGPKAVQDRLQHACSERLAHYAGSAYQNAVATCLRSSFDVELDDQKDSNLARAFQTKVVDQLGKGIVLL